MIEDLKKFMNETFFNWRDTGVKTSESLGKMLIETRKEKRSLFLNLANLESATIAALFAAKLGLKGTALDSTDVAISILCFSISIVTSYIYLFGILSENNKEIEWTKKNEEQKTTKILDTIITYHEKINKEGEEEKKLALALECNEEVLKNDEEFRKKVVSEETKKTFEAPHEWVEWLIISPFTLGYILLAKVIASSL